VEILNAFRGDAKHHSLRAESTAGSIYRRIKKMHGLYFLIFYPLQSFKLHLYKNETASVIYEIDHLKTNLISVSGSTIES
jgi:hypothetical protein